MTNPELVELKEPKLVALVKKDLQKGNLVVLLGGPCSGKTWLISQIFDDSSIIDKKHFALHDDFSKVTVGALDKWAARTKSSIAIDEIQLLKENELGEIASTVISCNKGLALAAQQEEFVPQSVLANFLNNGKRVTFYRFDFWKSGLELPTWEIYKNLEPCTKPSKPSPSETSESNSYLIWWTPDECEEDPQWINNTPDYIIDEYINRVGRAGRGRLWCARGMPESITVEWPQNRLCDDLAARFGGIVIRKQDDQFVRHMPGVITSLEMEGI